jgi:DNA-directed RNA polymerase specialized sigma24 family protein
MADATSGPDPVDGGERVHDSREEVLVDPREVRERALAFAREYLGPASERLVADLGVQVLLVSRMRGGAELEDAVLGEVHRASADRALANEFLAFFLTDMLRAGKPMISVGLHRFLDTWDLAQSVLGDVWPQLGELEFQTRARFISLLSQRLSWKSTGRARELSRGKRREDKRLGKPPEELELAQTGASPPSLAGQEEEKERLVLLLMRLPERDRDILRIHLRGGGVDAIMAETGLNYEAARKALQRAIAKARRLAGLAEE